MKEIQQITEVLTNRIIELEQRLQKNRSNSYKPPSGEGSHKPIQNNHEKSEKKPDRKKQSDSLRLIETLFTGKDQIMKFLTNPDVPFDNKKTERDLRMVRLKQKGSGCFRTYKGGEIFC